MTKESRNEFLRDVLVSACEGGINYWGEVVSYRPSKITARVVVDEKIHEINARVIRNGLKTIANGKADICKEYQKEILW
jgi:hypothetical protein